MYSRFFASRRSRNRLRVGLVSGGLLLLASCAVLKAHPNSGISFALTSLGSRSMTVEQLLLKEEKGRLGKSVKLQGQVVQRSPLLAGVVYQLEDPTGSIWVRSDSAKIELGQVLTIQGEPVYQEAVVDGLDFGGLYLDEQRRRVRGKK